MLLVATTLFSCEKNNLLGPTNRNPLDALSLASQGSFNANGRNNSVMSAVRWGNISNLDKYITVFIMDNNGFIYREQASLRNFTGINTFRRQYSALTNNIDRDLQQERFPESTIYYVIANNTGGNINIRYNTQLLEYEVTDAVAFWFRTDFSTIR